jgi:DNA-binding NtrC family response regulator
MKPGLKLQPNLPDKAVFYLLWAESLFMLGRYTESMRKVGVTLRLVSKSSEHTIYAKARYLRGMICIKLGRLTDAIEDLNESYACYKRIGDRAHILLPLNNLAQALFISGNLRRSREVLESSLSLVRESDPITAITQRINLARVLALLGEFSQSQKQLEAKCVRECTVAIKNKRADFVKGMVAVYKLESDFASRLLISCKQYFSKEAFAHDINVCQEYLGLLEYNRGNYKKAREYYQQVLDTPEPTASAVAQTLRMLTDVEIAERNWDTAMETAKKAEAAITKINERIELGALWRAYGQICTHRGEHDTARDFFSKSIDLLHEIGARYELALSYLACGNSESYNREERKFNLEMARMLFAEMEVPKRVEQVEKAIADLRLDSVSAPAISVFDRTDEPVMVVASPRMHRIVEFVSRVAESRMNVLLTGETGVGKDLLAKYIHHCSGRRGEFVMLNSAAIPNEMIESELFGFVRGAFTGAGRTRPGLFEVAENGTFYLNEIADSTPEFQTKLLEVLETREVRRLGENRIRKVNFRLIAATNHDLDTFMKENRFRLDLYHRLSEIPIQVPSLSERPEDIPALVEHFLYECGWRSGNGSSLRNSASSSLRNSASSTLPESASSTEYVSRLIELLAAHSWPGNVRQLKSDVSRLWLSSGGDIAEMVEMMASKPLPDKPDGLLNLLESTNWNRRETARILGVSETTVRNRIRRFNLA